jgi:hypothetical protein
MAASENLNELAAALSKTQAMLQGAVKDAKNDHFKSRYADLASCWDACREALAANGLSVVQLPEGDGSVVTMTTMLLHTSGQWVSCTGTFKPTKADPQGLGSCITYARRYQLCAIVGISPEDDDGNAASEPVKQQAKPERKPEPVQQARPKSEPKPAPKLQADLAGLLGAFGWAAPDRARHANTLLELVGYTLTQCQHSEEMALDAFHALDSKLSVYDGDDQAKLAALWKDAQNGGVTL